MGVLRQKNRLLFWENSMFRPYSSENMCKWMSHDGADFCFHPLLIITKLPHVWEWKHSVSGGNSFESEVIIRLSLQYMSKLWNGLVSTVCMIFCWFSWFGTHQPRHWNYHSMNPMFSVSHHANGNDVKTYERPNGAGLPTTANPQAHILINKYGLKRTRHSKTKRDNI